MRILALETTEKAGGVAAMDDRNLLGELELDRHQRSAQSLAPAVHALLDKVHWTPRDVQLVAIVVGPGSFTGLRVGVATAKVFAYAVGAEVIGVGTFEAIAAAAPEAVARLTAVVDAQRGDVVVQSFARGDDGWFAAIGQEELLPADEWLARLKPGDVVSGPGLTKLVDRLPAGVEALDRAVWPPKASVVGLLAWRCHELGRRDNLWELAPRYCRLSAAEEKWKAK